VPRRALGLLRPSARVQAYREPGRREAEPPGEQAPEAANYGFRGILLASAAGVWHRRALLGLVAVVFALATDGSAGGRDADRLVGAIEALHHERDP
jgi:hypothetical protein